jgi:hypothetical protein
MRNAVMKRQFSKKTDILTNEELEEIYAEIRHQTW